MKLIISVIYITNLLLVHLPPSTNNDEANDTITIATYKEDVTGNGSNETIKLKGILLSKNQSFYRDIWLEVATDENSEWTISYLGGYEPTVQFITLYNKKGKSIFFTSKHKNDQQKENSQLHSIINGKVSEEKLPEPIYMSGSFKDDFTVKLSMNSQLDPHIYQIFEKEYYQHMYSNTGQLLKQVPIKTGQEVTLTPTFISKSKKFGINSIQEVYNEQTNKKVGAIETLWYFENNRWIKIREQWISN